MSDATPAADPAAATTPAAPPAVPEPAPATPAVPDISHRPEGLEDLGDDDLVMPIVSIDHGEALFVDTLSGRSFPVLEGVFLGLIKQRVLWKAEVEANSRPLCKSYDFSIGHPDMKEFPWKVSGFERPSDEDAVITLPCDNCKLKDWGTHPNRDAPWCSAQHTFALLIPAGEEGQLAPALFTVQRSAIKPSRQYLTSFQRDDKPLFTCKTKVELQARKRGAVDFAVPRFIEGEATPKEAWPTFAEHYRRIRHFVQTPRSRDEDELGSDTSDAADSAVPASAAPSTGGPSVPDDDDLPF